MKHVNYALKAYWAILLLVFFTACQDDELVKTDTPAQEIEALSFTYKPIDGQYIIAYAPSLNGRLANLHYREAQLMSKQIGSELLSSNKIPVEGNIYRSYGSMFKGMAVRLEQDQLARLQSDPRILYVEQDYEIIMQRPPWEGGGGDDGGSTGQTTPWGITRVNGISSYTGSSKAYILDSGIDLDHPDLNVRQTGFNAFTSGRDAKNLDDGNGHGTHVAGTIAARNNDQGVIGVAPGALVVPVKVLDSRGSGSYSGVIAGVDYVGANGTAGDVANLSLGGPVSQALDDAVVKAASKGIIFCLAAGNDGADANNSSPARANGPNIYTVSAMSEGDNWASFSNFGNPPVDYCGPGVSVNSTWKDGSYRSISGTSMATPHVAGVALLGTIKTSGNVIGDPDGNADPIAVH